MKEENIFLHDQHLISRRYAKLDDDGTSAWLYITLPEKLIPIADAWVYNRIPAPPTKDIKSYYGGPPPAAIGFASDNSICTKPFEHKWTFIWSTDGESVALAKDGVPVAFIIAAQKPGYSRELIKNGPWGNSWSEQLFKRYF